MVRVNFHVLFCLLFTSSLFATNPPDTIVLGGKEVQEGERGLPSEGNGVGIFLPGPIGGDQYHAPLRLSTEEKRLNDVGVQVYSRSDDPYVLRLDIAAKNLGSIDVKVLSRRDSDATEALVQFLEKNEAITGNAKNFTYVIDKVTSYGLINFHQVVAGMDIPGSQLRIVQRDEVGYMYLTIFDPSNPMLDRSTWISQKELETRTIAIVESELGRYDQTKIIGKPEYRITYGDENADFFLVYETNYNYTLIQIDALSGELLSVGRLVNDG